jgi:hypothetical protein
LCTKGEKALRTAAFILRLLNGLYAIALFLILLGAAAFSGYVLWDSRQVLQSTREMQTALQERPNPYLRDVIKGFSARHGLSPK